MAPMVLKHTYFDSPVNELEFGFLIDEKAPLVREILSFDNYSRFSRPTAHIYMYIEITQKLV